MSDEHRIEFVETVARRNFPRGVPEGVDPASRLYTMVGGTIQTRSHGEFQDVLAWAEPCGELTFTHVCLTRHGFDAAQADVEVHATNGRTAKYRQALREMVAKRMRAQVVIRGGGDGE